jgi:hypothetical protein
MSYYIRALYKGARYDSTPSGRYWRHGIDIEPRRNYARMALWPILAVCAVFMHATKLEDYK